MLIHCQAGQMEVPQYVAVYFYGLKSNISSHYLYFRMFKDNKTIS
jgi:hypothetical protein